MAIQKIALLSLSPSAIARRVPSVLVWTLSRKALCQSGGGHRVLELQPLSRDATEKWLSSTLGPRATSEEVGEIAARLGGHPFSIREAIRLAGEISASKPQRGTEVGELHRKYLDTLTGDERKILEMLAVLGRPAPIDLIAVLLHAPKSELGRACESLVNQGTLREEAGKFSLPARVFSVLASEEHQVGLEASDSWNDCYSSRARAERRVT